jgi:hypothetical protein
MGPHLTMADFKFKADQFKKTWFAQHEYVCFFVLSSSARQCREDFGCRSGFLCPLNHLLFDLYLSLCLGVRSLQGSADLGGWHAFVNIALVRRRILFVVGIGVVCIIIIFFFFNIVVFFVFLYVVHVMDIQIERHSRSGCFLGCCA